MERPSSLIVVTIWELPGGGFVPCGFSGRNRFLRKNVFQSMFKESTVNNFLGLVNIGFNTNARAMTWSNYKHHNTIKFLIGVTPQGVISFISKAWGGRVSDKYLTEKSGLLRKLLPGDIVLADRGFDIADSVGLYQAHFHIPAFTRGKKQLSAEEVEQTRKIAESESTWKG